jgi:hypothetical protein
MQRHVDLGGTSGFDGSLPNALNGEISENVVVRSGTGPIQPMDHRAAERVDHRTSGG